jgi:cell division protein FtsX
MRDGLRDLRRMPTLVSVTVIIVALTTVFVLMYPLLEQVVGVGDAEVIRRSEVIVLLDEGLDQEQLADAVENLGRLNGVAAVHLSTGGDLSALSRPLPGAAEDLNLLTLELDGNVPVESVEFHAGEASGVVDVFLGVGVSSGLAVDLLELVTPWLAGMFALGGAILMANLAHSISRTRREEAQIMRLIGAGGLSIWIRLGAVVLIPVVATIVATTALVTIAWPWAVGTWIGPDAVELVSGWEVLRLGLLLAAAASLAGAAIVHVGLKASRS